MLCVNVTNFPPVCDVAFPDEELHFQHFFYRFFSLDGCYDVENDTILYEMKVRYGGALYDIQNFLAWASWGVNALNNLFIQGQTTEKFYFQNLTLELHYCDFHSRNASASIPIRLNYTNSPPTVTAMGTTKIYHHIGTALRLDLQAGFFDDLDHDELAFEVYALDENSLQYNIHQLTKWMSYDSVHSVIYGTPLLVEFLKNYSVLVQYTDNSDANETVLQIEVTNTPPVCLVPGDLLDNLTVYTNVPFSYSLNSSQFKDEDNDTVYF